jgi:hypothetical protein
VFAEERRLEVVPEFTLGAINVPLLRSYDAPQ